MKEVLEFYGISGDVTDRAAYFCNIIQAAKAKPAAPPLPPQSSILKPASAQRCVFQPTRAHTYQNSHRNAVLISRDQVPLGKRSDVPKQYSVPDLIQAAPRFSWTKCELHARAAITLTLKLRADA